MVRANPSQEVWDISRMMLWMSEFLGSHDDPNPKLSSQWLISDATGLSRTELFMQLDRPLSKDELELLRTHVKRRAAGEPLQYITGEAPFRYLSINVGPGVLIPRPETEVLVSELLFELPRPKKIRSAEYMIECDTETDEAHTALDRAFNQQTHETDASINDDCNDFDRQLLVADICTGSGCIACALATEHPDIRLVATDISEDAIELAKENVIKFGLQDRVEISLGDIGESINDDLMGSFDAVISNPPYIPTKIMDDLPSEVNDFEPRIALDGGADGLDIFRRLVKWSTKALKTNGVLAVELHEDTLDEARKHAEAMGFTASRITKDLTGRPRVLIARRSCIQ